MKDVIYLVCRFTIIFVLGLDSSCSWASGKPDKSVFVGSTPGDALIKSQLDIPGQTTIDFIKWDLTLNHLNRNTFVLNITYGESQPNTLGFKEGGQRKSYQGDYRIDNFNDNEIYYLESSDFQTNVTLIKLNANILHLLTPEKQLMVGNGGWSYTLNNKAPNKYNDSLPALTNSTNILKDTSLQVVYEGRTPCEEFAAEYKLIVSESCLKLKWRLVLNRDQKTLQPTTYTLKRTNSRETDITGNWTITKGTTSNPDALVLQLDPDKPNQTILLFVGDQNVLFFLHQHQDLFAGNDNFSFTLNRRK